VHVDRSRSGGRHQVAHRDLHHRDHGAALDVGLARELRQCALHHVDVDVRHRTEAATLDQDRLLVEHLGRLQDCPVGGEHRRPGESELHQLQAHDAIVDVPELDAGELDHVDLDALGRQAVEQRLHEELGLVVEEAGAVDQVDADDPERFLLRLLLAVEHVDVDEDLAVGVARMRLKAHPEPAVALARSAEAARLDGVGEDEERRGVATALAQALEIQAVLVLEHALQALAADVALAAAVDRVADRHVVRRDALGDGPGSAAGAEEPAHDLLSGTDLGERTVAALVEIDGERLLVRVDRMCFRHAGTASARSNRHAPRGGRETRGARRRAGSGRPMLPHGRAGAERSLGDERPFCPSSGGARPCMEGARGPVGAPVR